MVWKPLTTVQLSKDWQFSSINTSKYFRFRLTVSSSVVESLKVDIAQSVFDGNDVDYFDIQTVNFDKAKSIIIPFNTPDFLTDRRVAVKQNTNFYRSPIWLLSIEYYEDGGNNSNKPDITEIVNIKASEYLQKQGLIKSDNFLGTIEENLGFFSSFRNMFSVVGEKDTNIGAFSNDVSTLFLGYVDERALCGGQPSGC